MTLAASETKLCQSCIERGFKPAQVATREWLEGIFYCEDCFGALLNNLSNIAPASVTVALEEHKETESKLPLLTYIYQIYNVPEALQFDKVDTVCRNSEKIYNFHAPAIVNRSVEDLQDEMEQLSIAMFHIKYRVDMHDNEIKRLKQELRKEKNLASITDSREVYAKSEPKQKKSSVLKATQEEKMAKTLGITLEEYREMQSKAQEKNKTFREQKFNDIITGRVAK